MTTAIRGHLGPSGPPLGRKPDEQRPILSVADLVLLRALAGGAARLDLQRDLAPILAPRISGTEFRRQAEFAVGTLSGSALISEHKGKLAATAKGIEVALATLGDVKQPAAALDWPGCRARLILKSLGVADTPALRKALQRADSLAALILQRHFGMPLSRPLSLADLRAALAIVALERAFGNKIKTGLGRGSGLPAKAGRLLASQLLKQPREIATDGKLILALAADVAGTRETTLEAFELSLLRRLAAPVSDDNAAIALDNTVSELPPKSSPPKPANDRAPLKSAPPPTQAPSPPDMIEFRDAVLEVARPVSEGWPGNRKAFISLVWKAIRHARPDWRLSEIAFKGMLAEAHRAGQIELATADLKDGRDLKSLEESKILYKNTVWHFVRVQD